MATPATSTHLEPAPRKAARGAGALAAYLKLRAAATDSFAKNHRIRPLWQALTRATDALLQSASLPAGMTLIAVGGYGRRELFFYSDVDVLILLPDEAAPHQEQGVVRLLHALWDQQVPVSHATRSIDETVSMALQDATICAALMDARFVAGDRSSYLALKRRLRQEVLGRNPRGFVAAKLNERDVRHARFGDSRFLLEPNVKEGKGALRDLQTLNWLARYCFGTTQVTDVVRADLLSAAEWRHFRQAYLFFATVRAEMHRLRGRADERLSFDLQPTIAAALGFRGRTPQARAERLMMRYFQFARAVGNMTRMLCATLEEQQLRAQPASAKQDQVAQLLPPYLTVENGRLNFSGDADPIEAPHSVIGLFAASQEHGLDIHPRAQLALSRLLPKMGRRLPLDGESNRLFLSILLSTRGPDVLLRRMNEMGVLPAILPEFGKLCGQMQYDGYHTYTVDEHILVAIGNLRALELGQWSETMPLSTALARQPHDRAVLYVAMLCHDINKGTGGDHAKTGAQVAQHVAARLGLSKEEAALVFWLVTHHALLSDTAFKRDLDDQQTIDDFVAMVQSPERLRLLLLLTVADIRAVGPTIFNGWKGALMRTLYHRALEAMGVGERAEDIADHGSLLAQWKSAPDQPAIGISHDTFRDVSIVTLCVATAPHLFTTLAGALSALGSSIVSARIRQLGADEAAGASLAEFHIQDIHGKNFAEDEKRLRRLAGLLADPAALPGRIATRRRVANRRQVPVRSGVFIDNQVSESASVVEVNGRDRIGLLYSILRAMDEAGLQVMNAHIATYGQLAVDVFYVKDAYGHKLTHNARQAQLQQLLHEAIGDKEET